MNSRRLNCMCGRFEDGIETAKTAIDLDAYSFLSHRIAGLCCTALARYDEAIIILTELMKISDNHPQAVAALIWTYVAKGQKDEAQKLMKILNDRPSTEHRAGIYYGISEAWLGYPERGMDYLEQAYNDYDPQIMQLKYAPEVPENLKQHARFQNLLAKLALTSG